MKNLKIEFKDIPHTNGDIIGIASVISDSESKSELVLDNYLEKNYPQNGRKECHFEDNGKYYFHLV